MNKKIYTLVTFLSLFVFLESKAQFSKPVSVGLGGGGTALLGDLGNIKIGYGVHGDVDFLINPYISAGVNAQKGKLSADDAYGRSAENKYFALNGNVKVRIGQFFGNTPNYSYYVLSDNSFVSYLSNIYFGAGVGFISNNIDAERRIVDGVNVTVFDGLDKSKELVIPFNIGIDFPFGRSLYGPKWAINLNYQHSISTDDNVDGYSNQYSKSNDQYGYLSLGVKLALFNRK